jgi:hypothetical protein
LMSTSDGTETPPSHTLSICASAPADGGSG